MPGTRENRRFSEWNVSPGCPTAGSVKDDFFHGQPRSPGPILAGTLGLLDGAAGRARRSAGGQNCGESASDEGSDRSDPRDKIGQEVVPGAFSAMLSRCPCGGFATITPRRESATVPPIPAPRPSRSHSAPVVEFHLTPMAPSSSARWKSFPGGIA